MTKVRPLEFDTQDWLSDPLLTMCLPQTRGIWIDAIASMHACRSGALTGTPEQLSRICRCTLSAFIEAVADLKTTGAADVHESAEKVTLINRRMSREAKEREQNRLRKKAGRCHALVPELSHSPPSCSSSSSEEKKKEKGKSRRERNRGAADDRYQALIDWFFSQYQEIRGKRLVAVAADYAAVKKLLEKTRGQGEFSLEALKRSMNNFLLSADPFYLKMGKPLAFWAGNINAFLVPAPAVEEKKEPSCGECLNTGRIVVVTGRSNGSTRVRLARAPWRDGEGYLEQMAMNYSGDCTVMRCFCRAGQKHTQLDEYQPETSE